jgi:HEAT repeat protein
MLVSCLLITGCSQRTDVAEHDRQIPVGKNEPAVEHALADKQAAATQQEIQKKSKVLQALITQLEDEDPKVRRAAAEVLQGMGPDASAAVPALARVLRDKDYLARGMAARALGHVGPAAVPALIDALKDQDKEVRRDAAFALRFLGPQGKEAVPALMAALSDGDREVRINAAYALGEVGEDAAPAIPILIEAFKLPIDLGTDATNAVGKMGPVAVPLLLVALKDKNSNVRWCAAMALGDIAKGNRGPETQKAFRLLLESSQDSDKYIRSSATRTLGYFSAEATISVPVLMNQLNDPEPDVRQAAAVALSELSAKSKTDAVSVASLLRALQDKDSHVRLGAVRILEKIARDATDSEIEKALQAIMECLSDSDMKIRISAIKALGYFQTEAKLVVPALIGQLKDGAVRESAVRVLGDFGEEAKPAVPSLVRLFKGPDESLRETAARPCGESMRRHFGKRLPNSPPKKRKPSKLPRSSS